MSAEANAEHPLGGLKTEGVNPATVEIDRMSPLEIVQVMNTEDTHMVAAVRQELPHIARAIEEIAARLRQGGRLVYIGAGSSGRLGLLDASECPPTFNTPPDQVIGLIAGGIEATAQAFENVEDDADTGQADVARLAINEKDVVVGIAASGRTPYTLGAITYAKERGALTIGVACNAATPLENIAHIMIAPLVGPEVIAGSTRLKAGTAQKMVLNMLSTGAMIILSKTFGNLMVDVQATNYKLRERAIKIVQQATGLDHDAAASLLRAADDETKTAIAANRLNVAPKVARERLAAHGNILRTTLEAGQ